MDGQYLYVRICRQLKGIKNFHSLRNSSLVARHIGFNLSIACCVLQAQRTKFLTVPMGDLANSFPAVLDIKY